MEPRSIQVLVFLVSLLSTTFAILVLESCSTAENPPGAVEFHQLTGGIGSGTSTDISICPAAFDPRLDEGCAANLWPIPGGGCFCPAQAGPLIVNTFLHSEHEWQIQ